MYEHGNETPIVVRPHAESFLEINGDLFFARREQTHQGLAEKLTLKQASGFISDALTQELASRHLVRLAEFFDLFVRLVGKDGNDKLFICAQSLDGVTHGLDFEVVIDLLIVVDVRRVALGQGSDDAFEVAAHLPLTTYGFDEIFLINS